jgi:hypothetical protein
MGSEFAFEASEKCLTDVTATLNWTTTGLGDWKLALNGVKVVRSGTSLAARGVNIPFEGTDSSASVTSSPQSCRVAPLGV